MGKYRSTRGQASHDRDRSTLHKKHLANFVTWFADQPGWKILHSTPHPHEVFHCVQIFPEGEGEHQFIYVNDHNDHLTVQYLLVPYVKSWLRQRQK